MTGAACLLDPYVIAYPDGVMAHRSRMLTGVNRISTGKFLVNVYSVFNVPTPEPVAFHLLTVFAVIVCDLCPLV